MNFECKQLYLTDDPEFGCEIEFSDKMETGSDDMTAEELFDPTTKYLLIQRSYPAEENDNDWYSIETSEADIDYSQKDKMYVTLSPERFEFYCAGLTIGIGLNLSKNEYEDLERMLRTQFKDQVVMLMSH